jgi:2-polyprenyl-3-methyl-5-hydroxy-6-metoxy-1,4-benzoquinol methylase
VVVSVKKHFATEKRDLDYCIKNFSNSERGAEVLIRKLKLDKSMKLLEIGAAQGSLLIALSKKGYNCEGIEPTDFALETAKKLSTEMRQAIKIKKGFVEEIPYEGASFNVVIAESVMEHVIDICKAFNEISRVLKPGGIFYFTTASAMCPKQAEIQYFPFFPWYPQRAKLWIMNWAKINKPSLVGWTDTPAINWFTPRSTKRLLADAGLQLRYDNWDLVDESEVPIGAKRVALKIIKLNKLTKLTGDVLHPICEYLAIRNS